MPDPNRYIGYVEYVGEGVEEGLLDARKAAKALLGFDNSLRFFVSRQHPEFQQLDYEIPVRIEKGSWQALLPQTVEQWLMTAAGIATTAYLTAAATQMAQRDLKDVGLRDVFQKALQGIQWFIKIGKHLGKLGTKKFEGVRWQNNNTEIGIPNQNEEFLFVPKEFLDWFVEAPHPLLSDLSEVISLQRQLNVGIIYPDYVETVTITQSERHIFFVKKEDEDILFPDLKHGQQVVLDGLVTRGNEKANSIGFLYREHILTCYPRQGNIVRFKQSLFLNCRIAGTITRIDGLGGTNDPRPKIIFDDLIPLKKDSGMLDLFEKTRFNDRIESDDE